MTDEVTILMKAAKGDGEAFRELLGPVRDDLYRLAYAFTGDQAEAEDVLQAAFERIFLKLKTFRGQSSFKTWAYRVTINVAKRAVSKRKYAAELDEQIPSGTLSPEAKILNDERNEWIRKSVMRLPKLQRTVVLMRLQDIEYDIICADLGITMNNAKSTHSQALKRLNEWARAEGLL